VKCTGITDLMNRAVMASTARPEPAAEITLPGIPASASLARRFVRDALPGCPRADDLILAVSELASNAIAWSASGRGGMFTVRVRTTQRLARAEVTDEGPAQASSASRNGWGLGIVTAVTDRAGSVVGADSRRTAWAEVTWAP